MYSMLFDEVHWYHVFSNGTLVSWLQKPMECSVHCTVCWLMIWVASVLNYWDLMKCSFMLGGYHPCQLPVVLFWHNLWVPTIFICYWCLSRIFIFLMYPTVAWRKTDLGDIELFLAPAIILCPNDANSCVSLLLQLHYLFSNCITHTSSGWIHFYK